MIDQYVYTGNTQALSIATQMGDWVYTSVEAAIAQYGMDNWQQVLDTEWGGMNDGMLNLYTITGNANHLAAARRFNHWSWSAPLAIGEDDLTNEHANTHIPEVIGNARAYELTGNNTDNAIATNFFHILHTTREWATGGSNSRELWPAAHQLGSPQVLDKYTQESCTTYNMLKLAKHLYSWSANASFMDFYEKALFNGIIGNANFAPPYMPENHTQGYIYFLPLGGGGLVKGFKSGLKEIPCCWGTLSESFSKFQDTIYYRSSDDSVLFLNLFVSSTLNWREKQVVVTQVSTFPNSTVNTFSVSLEVANPGGTQFTFGVRIPSWTVLNSDAFVSINGVGLPQSSLEPGNYLMVNRTWITGDTITAYFPASLRWEKVDDNRTMYDSIGAILYGNILLAGHVNSSYLPTLPSNVTQFLTRSSATSLEFQFQSSFSNFSVIPLKDVLDEQYTVYFNASLPFSDEKA